MWLPWLPSLFEKLPVDEPCLEPFEFPAEHARASYAVQVMGKLRGAVDSDPDADQATIEALARALDTVNAFIAGKELAKVVFVKGRLINFVTKG